MITKDWVRLLSEPLVIRAAIVLLGTIAILLVVRIAQHAVATRIEIASARYRMRKWVSLGGYLLVLLFMSLVFKDQLGHIAVVFGVIGAGVAFALQEIIASFGGWVVINLGGYYRVGDRIRVNDILGDVIDIGTLKTTIMECGGWVDADLYSGRIIHLANSTALSDPIYNYTTGFHFLWDEIVLPVKYGSDLRVARNMLERIAQELLDDFASQAKEAWLDARRHYLLDDELLMPMVTLIATDNWVEFTLRYLVDYKERRQMKDRLFTRILDEIELSGGHIAIASTTIQFVDPAPFEIRIDPVAQRPAVH